MQYQINIKFSPQGLNQVHASGEWVTIAKELPNEGGFPIAWLTFQPLQSNQISWHDNYSIYTTANPLVPGAVLSMSSETGTAQLGWLYSFQSGTFEGKAGGGNAYSALNLAASPGSSVFGLAQTAEINGVSASAPVSAAQVPANNESSFAPGETVAIFLSMIRSPGTVMNGASGNALTINLTPQHPTASVVYDEFANAFKLA
jgi:hypothetical protein